MRKTYVFGNDFWEFYNSQKKEVPVKYFKHLEGTDGLFEIRIKVGSDIYRIICFFDEGNLIILLNGFQKKSEKTPSREIEKAKLLKLKYYEEKSK